MEQRTGGVGEVKKYAVNLVALMNAGRQPERLPIAFLLRGIVTETVVQTRPNVPGHDSLLVRDDVPHDRWAAIVQIIRSKLPYNEFPLYEKPQGKSWKTIR